MKRLLFALCLVMCVLPMRQADAQTSCPIPTLYVSDLVLWYAEYNSACATSPGLFQIMLVPVFGTPIDTGTVQVFEKSGDIKIRHNGSFTDVGFGRWLMQVEVGDGFPISTPGDKSTYPAFNIKVGKSTLDPRVRIKNSFFRKFRGYVPDDKFADFEQHLLLNYGIGLDNLIEIDDLLEESEIDLTLDQIVEIARTEEDPPMTN